MIALDWEWAFINLHHSLKFLERSGHWQAAEADQGQQATFWGAESGWILFYWIWSSTCTCRAAHADQQPKTMITWHRRVILRRPERDHVSKRWLQTLLPFTCIALLWVGVAATVGNDTEKLSGEDWPLRIYLPSR